MHLLPALLQATTLSKTKTSWKFRKIRGEFVMRNPVTMATKIMASLSSAFRLPPPQLSLGPLLRGDN